MNSSYQGSAKLWVEELNSLLHTLCNSNPDWPHMFLRSIEHPTCVTQSPCRSHEEFWIRESALILKVSHDIQSIDLKSEIVLWNYVLLIPCKWCLCKKLRLLSCLPLLWFGLPPEVGQTCFIGGLLKAICTKQYCVNLCFGIGVAVCVGEV